MRASFIKVGFFLDLLGFTPLHAHASLLNCAPSAYTPYPSLIHALPIINTRRHNCAPLPSSIGALRAFVLSSVVLLRLKGR